VVRGIIVVVVVVVVAAAVAAAAAVVVVVVVVGQEPIIHVAPDGKSSPRRDFRAGGSGGVSGKEGGGERALHTAAHYCSHTTIPAPDAFASGAPRAGSIRGTRALCRTRRDAASRRHPRSSKGTVTRSHPSPRILRLRATLAPSVRDDLVPRAGSRDL